MERDCLEDPGVDGRITLKLTLKKHEVRARADRYISGWMHVTNYCEHGNEHFGYIKCG
jgi:hypothetical protein